jgi:dGTP triphosphohydrolase
MGYAGSVKNNTLMAQFNYTENKLDKLSKDVVDDVCKTIREVTDLNMVNAHNFGINASDTSDLQSTIDLYRVGMQSPRQAIINKSDAIRNIKQLIREIIDDLFKLQMDKMVNTLKKSNPSFVGKYYQARMIIQLGSSTTKIRGTVNNTENKKPIYAASVILRLSGQSTVAYQTKSGNNGLFHISDIKPGNYDIEVTHPDFIAFSETNIYFAPGKKIQRKYIHKKAATPPISE